MPNAFTTGQGDDTAIAGVALTGHPECLASGLETLERTDGSIWERLMVPRSRTPDPTLLSSHPPTEERARRLCELQQVDDGTSVGGTLEHSNQIEPPAGYPPIQGPPGGAVRGSKW